MNIYPYLRVILAYTLLGGALGGLLLGVYGMLVSMYSYNETVLNCIKEMNCIKDTTLDFIRLGIKFGTIPALCSGLWLAWQRIQRSFSGLIHASLAGALFSALFTLVLLMVYNIVDSIRIITSPLVTASILFFMGVIGAASAMILGIFVLPKRRTENSGA